MMSAKLEAYNQKRNFEITLEPKGGTENSEEGLRFVVQLHMARREHYDFRLEWDGVLLSWAVPKGPSYNPRDKRLAVQVEDHPLEYRNFEGTIPKGEYGGGTVILWDEGIWQPYGNIDEGLHGGSLKFLLRGKRLRGKWALILMKPKIGETKKNWLLIKEKDPYTKFDSGISEFVTSIRTGRTMAEIEKGEGEKFTRNPFEHADAQLARLVNKPPEGGDWLYELKYDGYRILTYIEGGIARLITRNGNDYTNRFQHVAEDLMGWSAGRAMVLDGEMVVMDHQGRPDFEALQAYMKSPKDKKLAYIVFDILALDGVDLRERPLLERKKTLEALMKEAPKSLHYSQHVAGNGKEGFIAACELGLEGIIGKRADAPYSGTRNGDWIKLKCDKRQEFVIGGYTLTDKKVSGVSALLLGIYENEELIYAGRAGTGMSMADMKELETKFKSIKRPDAPFKLAPKARANETMTWLEPELVAEIKFAEWTEDNLLRQASFKGLRADKAPGDIKKEKPYDATQSLPPAMESEEKMETSHIIIEGIKITSPDKVIFDSPEITKADVVRYYAQVSDHMLPYVSRRILSIVRCPRGISQSCFYKKHPDLNGKGIITTPIANSDGEMEDYFYIEDVIGLVFEAQMGTLEFHTWGSRVDEPEKPDVMVFDLDPDEGMDIGTVRQGVKDLKSVLEELSLISYLKTSGGKGYHVVVPLKPTASWEVFRDFARRVAEVMERKWPNRYTSNVRKNKRVSKIFIDWIRNGRGATSIAPYSIRARAGARVSMPIAWEELDAVTPDGVTMADALIRITADDPWKDFYRHHQMLR